MNGKPMLSVERELLAKLIEEGRISEISDAEWKELRALLDKEVLESQYDGMTQGQAQDVSDGVDEILHGKPAAKHQGEPVAWVTQCLISGLIEQAEPNEKATNLQCWTDAFPVYAEKPGPVADHTQCEECKGWGYHENHHEGGGTECGECSGSGKAPVEQFSGDTVVCRRYQLEQHPGQNFYHYDLEPVYGSVPVTVSELITLAESAPPAVVMPEPYGLAMFKMLSGFDSVTPEQFNLVWTACRKEVARLNGVKP